jgi:hypothetical protein
MSLTNGHNANIIAEKRRVIEAMYNDCIRGKQKYQIREKFTDGGYDNSSKSDRSFFEYWNGMIDKFAEEFEENKKQLKSKFISRYLFLYEKFVEEKNYKGAREVLDSLKKMTGMDEPIEANIDLSGELIVDFGLGNETEV